MKQKTNFVFGIASLLLGFLGALLPVLPSTCFLISAAYFFGKSSPRFEAWMLNHPKYGHAIRSWRETRSIPLVGKIAAVGSMVVSGVLLSLSQAPMLTIVFGLFGLVFSGWYVLSRPTLGKLELSLAK
jgi:uncharacterized membrane protein YbaN (DUF454 family)